MLKSLGYWLLVVIACAMLIYYEIDDPTAGAVVWAIVGTLGFALGYINAAIDFTQGFPREQRQPETGNVAWLHEGDRLRFPRHEMSPVVSIAREEPEKDRVSAVAARQVVRRTARAAGER